MKLTEDIKRMLDALAYANAGDFLTPSQKQRALANSPSPVARRAAPARKSVRPQVGLFLGSELPGQVLQYVTQTCTRLGHGLTVLTFLAEDEARAALAPHRAELEAADIEIRIAILEGEPPTALADALRRRTEVAFLVCNESGYFGHGLLNGTQRNGGMPIPVVLMSADGAGAGQVAAKATQARVRAA